MAYGTKCKPRYMILRLKKISTTKTVRHFVTWQAATIAHVTSTPSSKSKKKEGEEVLVYGTIHDINISDVLYIDIGKETSALRRVENKKLKQEECFSLLTKSGSLDLRVMPMKKEEKEIKEKTYLFHKEKRNALVSCFCLLMDEVHQDNWRALYYNVRNNRNSRSH
eukprot:4478634-Ditylum_brightwellii.AAC.1